MISESHLPINSVYTLLPGVHDKMNHCSIGQVRIWFRQLRGHVVETTYEIGIGNQHCCQGNQFTGDCIEEAGLPHHLGPDKYTNANHKLHKRNENFKITQ